MSFEDFLAVFRSLNEHSVEYVLAGAFAQAMHGRSIGTEHIDVVVEETHLNGARIAEAFDALWGDAGYRMRTAAGMRMFPPSTAMMLELFTCTAIPAYELLDVCGTLVRVSPFDESFEVSGQILPKELRRAVCEIVSHLAPSEPAPRGVRKFRSFDDLTDDREHRENARIARVRSGRLIGGLAS